MFFRKTKKMAVGIILALFVFSSFAEFIVSAEPAQAQMGVAVISDAVRQVDDIWATIKNGWKIAVMNAAQQAVGYFLRKVAYDSAVWLASGGKGQSPFAHTNSVGSYLKDVGNDAAGAAIDSLGKGFGLDLCKIPDVKVDLALRIGLHYNYGAEPPKPACNLTTFASNWSGAIGSVYNNGVDTSKIFAASLKVEDTDLGINIKATEKVDRLYLQQTDDARASRLEGGGFKPVLGLLDNRYKTPAAVVSDEMKANAPNKQNDKSQAQIGAALGSGAYEIIPSTLSIFLNTLGSQMLKNFRENGMLPFGAGCVSVPGVTGGGKCPAAGNNANNPNSAGTELTGRAAAEAVFSEFLTPKITSALDYDILSQLSSGCDSDRQHIGLYNCRLDQSLVLAIQEAKHGNPPTIAEAINKGWLHGSGKLIPPSNVALNVDTHCADNNNYCYSNIVVLRQLGILPLGFEIAAKNSDPDQPVSLEDVVKKFYDCNYKKDIDGNVIGVNYDPVNYPYCHLIDPNWVIKLDQTRCDALGYGATPIGNSVPDRLQECVDLKTCVGYDAKGNCLGWGYCAREKNIWKFDATKCDGQFATCRTFTNSQGEQLSYLYRTLDTGSCNQNNSGCSAYSLSQDANGWNNPQAAKTFESRDSIYLNNKVSACDASAAGCTMFKLVKGPSASNAPGVNNIGKDTVTFKKAPDYLNCYDSDSNSANGITWPQTLAELLKMNSKPQCKDYAQVCIASEVGCSNFKNADDADAPIVPGKFLPAQIVNNSVVSWNDQCDARCVGYDAYQEMPTTYSSGNPIAYIIPPSKYNNNQSGLECNVSDNNCTSFTNMEATESGGEKVENFTLLRNCIKPDENKQKNFYTYEGSKQGGYQLQVYTLQKGADGSPLTVFKDIDERAFADQYKCNETLYKSHTSDPDCRQFNDDQGKVYYALLPNTVAVSGDCSQYRLNSSEFTVDGKCFGNGVLKDGACYYYGLPGGVDNNAGASKTCTAEMVSCRAYKGNHGNNIQSISLNPSSTNPIATFETPDSFSIDKGWTVAGGSASLSNESTHVGEHSLELAGANAVLSKSLPALGEDVDKSSAQSFDLTFWAKGTGLNVSVGMNNDISPNVSAGVFTANNTWQVFRFHIKLPASASTTINNLTFTLQGSGSLFLDNVHLVKVSDYIYLVKNSLKIDSICDDEPGDNLPGAALGCSAYTGPQNSLGDTLYYLTNFSYLCRDGAIGCTAFKDTFNKKISDPGPNTYNVFLPVASGGVKAETKIGGATYSCQVEQGQTGCYVNVKGSTPQEIASASVNKAMAPIPSASTYFVPADTSDSSTIYLVAKNDQVDFTCNEVDVGCTYAGKQSVTPAGIKYVTTTIKIDPNQFESFDASNNPQSGILCQKEAVGCDEYNSSKGPAYFKNPALSGNNICSFHSYTDSVTNKTTQGWFWKGVSVCGSTSTPSVLQSPTKYCTDDTDCSVNNICLPDQKDKQACYPDYKKNGNYFDLWSYGDTGKYKNFVGECPTEQDTCTEFVDHADKDQAYYYLDNGKLTEGDCAGQVSQKAGCVLFDQTDRPNKIYAVTSTYLQSDNTTYDPTVDLLKVSKVNPVTVGDLQANRIIAVKRDRECAEWLQCKDSQPAWDPNAGVTKTQCNAIGRCDQLPSDSQPGDVNNCAGFIDGAHELSNKILTPEIYASRDISWKGKDFSGYSILGAYPLEELAQLNFGQDSNKQDIWKIAKPIICDTGAGDNCLDNSGNIYGCDKLSQPCAKNQSGLCVNHVCVQGPFGGHSNALANIDNSDESPSTICRAYPDKDSPFPNSNLNNTQAFEGVNKCDETANASNSVDAKKCECNYTKVSYGQNQTTKYWSYDQPNSGANAVVMDPNNANIEKGHPATGICFGGDKSVDGKKACSSNADCDPSLKDNKLSSNGSVCQLLKKQSKLIGWPGYCLEKDLSRNINGNKDENPCLTWLPIDYLIGVKNPSDQDHDAGFLPPSGPNISTKYCLAVDYYGKRGNHGYCEDPAGAQFLGLGTSCSDSVCQAMAASECGTNNYDVSGSSCGGTALNLANCDHFIGQDDCNIRCIAKNPNLWEQKFSGSSQVGCAAAVQMAADTDAVGWTNRLWEKNWSPYIAKVQDNTWPNFTELKKKLNYNIKTTSTPFALIPDAFEQGLLVMKACRGSNYYYMPNSDGTCDPNQTPAVYNNQKLDNLAYEPWFSIQTASGCYQDVDCNKTTTSTAACVNHEASSPTICRRSCFKDTDCTGNNIGGIENLGICKGGFCTNNSAKSCQIFNGNNDCETQNTIFAQYQTGSNPILSTSTQNICYGKCNDTSGAFAGKVCSQDAACFVNKCEIDKTPGGFNRCVAINPPPNLTKFVGFEDKINAGLKQLSQIFAKVNFPDKNILYFDDTKNKYVFSASTTDFDSSNLKADYTYLDPKPPEIHPVGPCDTNKQCLELQQEGFNINGLYDKNVVIDAKPYTATARFFFHADSNHMPIKSLKIIWGDEKTPPNPWPGYYRNRLGAVKMAYFGGVLSGGVLTYPQNNAAGCDNGFCELKGLAYTKTNITCTADADCYGKIAEQCVSVDNAGQFGNIMDQTCINSYKENSHTYNCVPGDKYAYGEGTWEPSCDSEKDPLSKLHSTGCCVFQPRIQVVDNWGWCNGVCGDANSPGGTKCFGKTECGGFNAGTNPNAHSSTIFGSKVLVAPSNIK